MKHEDDSDVEEGEEGMEADLQVAAGEERREQAVLGQRLKEWVTRTETITQSAIGWLKDMETGYAHTQIIIEDVVDYNTHTNECIFP